jgi:hypothetical protein
VIKWQGMANRKSRTGRLSAMRLRIRLASMIRKSLPTQRLPDVVLWCGVAFR